MCVFILIFLFFFLFFRVFFLLLFLLLLLLLLFLLPPSSSSSLQNSLFRSLFASSIVSILPWLVRLSTRSFVYSFVCFCFNPLNPPACPHVLWTWLFVFVETMLEFGPPILHGFVVCLRCSGWVQNLFWVKFWFPILSYYSQTRVVRRDFPAYCTPQILDSGTFGENSGFQGCRKQVPVLWANHQQWKLPTVPLFACSSIVSFLPWCFRLFIGSFVSASTHLIRRPASMFCGRDCSCL